MRPINNGGKKINIAFYRSEIRYEFWAGAANLVRDIDMNDIAFVTLAQFLSVKLWTGDRELMKGLARKGYTNFITTDELYKLRSLLEQ